MPKGDERGRDAAVGEGRGGGVKQEKEVEVGKRVDSVWKEEGQGGRQRLSAGRYHR